MRGEDAGFLYLRKNLRRLGMFYMAVGMTILTAIVLTIPSLSR